MSENIYNEISRFVADAQCVAITDIEKIQCKDCLNRTEEIGTCKVYERKPGRILKGTMNCEYYKKRV